MSFSKIIQQNILDLYIYYKISKIIHKYSVPQWSRWVHFTTGHVHALTQWCWALPNQQESTLGGRATPWPSLWAHPCWRRVYMWPFGSDIPFTFAAKGESHHLRQSALCALSLKMPWEWQWPVYAVLHNTFNALWIVFSTLPEAVKWKIPHCLSSFLHGMLQLPVPLEEQRIHMNTTLLLYWDKPPPPPLASMKWFLPSFSFSAHQ